MYGCQRHVLKVHTPLYVRSRVASNNQQVCVLTFLARLAQKFCALHERVLGVGSRSVGACHCSATVSLPECVECVLEWCG
jgi:hypothetical protein